MVKLNDLFYHPPSNNKITLDLDELIKSRGLLQANSGGGKSHAIRKVLEKSYGKVQQVVVDPEGEFHTLREKYGYLLVGKGENADIQLEVRSAPLLAKRIMETGASVIIDLYELNPGERIRFVKVFIDAVVNLPKSLWHKCLIVIDEIHTFAPEKTKAESLGAVAALASRGRKRGYALLGATQRISKFNKDVAAELNTKFIGRCTLDVDQKRAASEVGLSDHTKLRELKHEFLCFGPAMDADGVTQVKFQETETSHEELGNIRDVKVADDAKLKKMLANFAELPQEAANELKTKEDLQKKIRSLTAELRSAKSAKTGATIEEVKQEFLRGVKTGRKEASNDAKRILDAAMKDINYYKRLVKQAIAPLQAAESHNIAEHKIELYGKSMIEPKEKTQKIDLTHRFTIPTTEKVEVEVADFTAEEGAISLSKSERRMLIAIVQRPEQRATKQQIAIVSGYSSKSGSFNNNLSHMSSMGLISRGNGFIQATEAGVNAVGNYEPLSEDPQELLEFWCSKVGGSAGRMLRVIAEAHPEAITKEELGEKTGYSTTSGSFNNNLSKMSSTGLIVRINPGEVKATEELFPN